MPLLADGLLPASFRGAAFAVQSDSIGGGRRQAVHVYPGKDVPWAEDMGRAPRTFSFRGFITTGDVVLGKVPVQLQRVLLLAALEKAGPGTLTHPVLGILTVSVTRFSMGQDLGAGRMSAIDVEFVEAGKQTFPSLLVSGSKLLSAIAGAASIALDVLAAARAITAAVGGTSDAGKASSSYAGSVVSAGADATSLLNLAAQLPGNNGRYSAGANSGFTGDISSPYFNDIAVADLIADASAQRAAITAAASAVSDAGAALYESDDFSALCSAIESLIASLVDACANPADAVRLLISLIGVPPVDASAVSAGGAPMVMAFQRYACFALGQVCGQYQPSSYDDAATVLQAVAGVIDTVAIAAADAGDDASFEALDALTVAVVADLRARGAELAPMKTFVLQTPLPDVVLAQKLYRDPSRADQLLGEIDPVHPLFCPLTFQALAA